MTETPKVKKFRGLSSLEEQVANLAVHLSEMSEKLPSNLARKFLSEMHTAASKSINYYIDISGRKNYALEDTISFIKDLPENTIFYVAQVREKFRHHPSTILSALNKLYETDEDVDIIRIPMFNGDSYLKPSNSEVKLNTRFKSKLRTEGIKAQIIYTSKEEDIKLIELTRESIKEAEKIRKLERERFRKSDYSSHPDELSKDIALEFIGLAEQYMIQKTKEELEQKGYVKLGWGGISFDDAPWRSPFIKIRDEREKKIREIKLKYPFYQHSSNDVYWDNFPEEFLMESGLISPTYTDGTKNNCIIYDPKLIREVRARKFFQKAQEK